jgi:hypothetical protein
MKAIRKTTVDNTTIEVYYTGKEYAGAIPSISKYYIDFGRTAEEAEQKTIEYLQRRNKRKQKHML